LGSHRQHRCSSASARRWTKKTQADGTTSPDACLGRSAWGITTKIHAVTDALGNPARLHLSAGQRADISQAEATLGELCPDALIADKGYDSEPWRAALRERGIEPVIPSRCSNSIQHDIDTNLYKDRNKVERFWNRLKHYRRIATRYDKTARNFFSFLCLAATIQWLL
jgi:putative transposase